MQILYPDGEPTNFETFLSRLIQWRRASFEDRTKQLFDMLDYDGDGTLTPSDLSILMQNANQTKFQLGDRVRVRYSPKKGVLRHYGPVHMGNGTWAGIELDEPLGLNNGTVDGTTYFKTTDKHGSFVEARHIELVYFLTVGAALQHWIGNDQGRDGLCFIHKANGAIP
ncbi:CAP Gly-rich domain-containing protein [Gorgonomyces haynaldii]|nr:CAP Gly-rich domain-containing protein [Gorgonomyces haynaldii]